MAEKRHAENDGDQPIKKHRFNGSSNPSKRHGQGVDETYGQRWAFGNLNAATVPKDEDLEWEDEGDALAYLKSVRQQAEGIPHVMIAKKAGPELPTDIDGVVDRSIYEDGKGDFRGYYYDGAYTAYPDGYGEEEDVRDEAQDGEDDSSEIKSEGSSLLGPRNSNVAEINEAYFVTLTQKYTRLRKVLQSKPPDAIVAALPHEHSTEVNGFGALPSPFKQWSVRLRNTDPLPAQIASMHKDSVLRLLRIILNGNFFRRGQELRERTSRWIWALLARLPEKGELDYQEIGWVRELGKRAVMFMLSLAEADVLREQFGVDGNAGSENGAEAEVEDGFAEDASQHDYDEAASPSETEAMQTTNSVAYHESSPKIPGSSPAGKLILAAQHVPETAEGIPSPPSDVEMGIESEEEEGEVSTAPQAQNRSAADIEAAKARLLAQLEDKNDDQPVSPQTNGEATTFSDKAPGETPTQQDDQAARVEANLRATLNVILTVAGEFYGQRDLLEFRDPFGRIVEGLRRPNDCEVQELVI